MIECSQKIDESLLGRLKPSRDVHKGLFCRRYIIHPKYGWAKHIPRITERDCWLKPKCCFPSGSTGICDDGMASSRKRFSLCVHRHDLYVREFRKRVVVTLTAKEIKLSRLSSPLRRMLFHVYKPILRERFRNRLHHSYLKIGTASCRERVEIS